MALTQLPEAPTVTTRSAALRLEVRAIMAQREITGQQLAAALGKSQPAISDRLRGRTSWTIDETDELEYVFGLEPGELLRRVEAVTCALRGSNPGPTD